MRLIYTLGIFLYGLLLKAAAPFNRKAALWVDGRRGLFGSLAAALHDVDREKNPLVWFHASSLGEFEQGRPVIEALRETRPGCKILLTFFSPSGYEVRKNYEAADWVFYLPLDTPANARRLVQIIRPEKVIFIKYDFWFNLMASLWEQKVPVYFISVMFRPGQHFFRWYGGWFRKQLGAVTWFFAQNPESAELMHGIGKQNVTVAGDTRFDRVFAISARRHSVPAVEAFTDGQKVFVCGSTWKEDEAILMPLINKNAEGLKFIIAPHHPSPERIQYILDRLEKPVVRYSQLTPENAGSASVLLIDSVGILARLYQYATLAYVGGGFGAGLHNIQEPVTFGVPVFIGPGYHKFREAVELVALGGVFCVNSSDELILRTSGMLNDQSEYTRVSELCRKYVDDNRGATAKIMSYFRGEKLNSL
ncbi:MAG: glycosyltransferase N-terminal domain-containing protein [Bacteroidota bacterium]